MRKLLEDVDLKFILTSFFVWRAFLFVFLHFSVKLLPLQRDHLGGGLGNYVANPYLWAFSNFDGEHYLSIAQYGYKSLQYFYFPAYPMLLGMITKLFKSQMVLYNFIGQGISNLMFLVALIGLWKLIGGFGSFKDVGRERLAKLTIILLLLFPTSFYFASVYTESLYLAISVWSFYLIKQRRWVLVGVLAGILTAVRIVGLALIPAIIGEFWKKGNKSDWIKKVVAVLLVPVGLLVYMYFLKMKTGDPLDFLHNVNIFGEQRSSGFILLPQVFYRYIFKVLPNINYNYLPVVFTTWLEFVVAIVFGGLGVLGIFGLPARMVSGSKRKPWRREIPLSWGIYLIVGYLIPTLYGSFSSLPRYVLVLFPAYVLTAAYLQRLPRYVQIIIFILLFISLGVASSLFFRGHWIA